MSDNNYDYEEENFEEIHSKQGDSKKKNSCKQINAKKLLV